MKVVEIRQEAEFQEMRPAWDELLRHSSSRTIFLTWEWVAAWWSAYGTAGDLRLLAAFDNCNILRGIAPLRRQSVRRYGQSIEALSFIGDGSADSEYLDCIIASGYEGDVLEAFGRHWSHQLELGVVLLLNEIPEASAVLSWMRMFSGNKGALWAETAAPCGTVRLPGSWDDYLDTLRPRFRTKIRSVLRRLEDRPEVRFTWCTRAEQLDRILPALFDLHTRRWRTNGKPGVFGWDQKRHFYYSLSARLLDRGWLRLSQLEWNGQILACQYGFAYDGAYFHLQEGYEPAAEHWSVGTGLRAWSVRELINEGVREYDFLGGIGRHKSDWGAEVKESKNVILARAGYRNLLFCRAPAWEASMRECLVRVIPNKVLAIRRARMASQTQGGEAENRFRNCWLRQAAASLYVHLRLPRLTRRLRQRHQLSVSSNGQLPRITLARKPKPTGRILYYHRVNDDRDPFFTATPTWLFERQMRYVARHYNVVSLSEMLKRLDESAPGNMLAITFDDGYQDNYHCAFPVLQRYALPATIFLTTGSIDSREPLWFEQLLLALKTTQREFIDLEFDIPRRFWTRTQAERLNANSQLIKLLRDLPDSQRRIWLEEILRKMQLPVCQTERNGKMLTWDQIRDMNARAIDFGGHTVTHPFVSKLTNEQGVKEISECKERIEAELQVTVNHFAYPNGREEDFMPWNKDLIRAVGYSAAVTTIWGNNDPSTDRMELRRGGPWESTPELFAYKLDWYELMNQ